jgi:hypothetical protein
MSISYFVKLLEKKQYVAAELLLTEKLVDVNANFEGKSLIFWFSYYVRSVPDNFMLAYDLLETLIVNGADPTYGLNKNQTFKTQMDLFLRGTAILFTRSATLELSLLRFTPARRAVCKYVKELVSLPNLDQVLETCNTIKLEDIPNFVALNGGPKRCEADAPQLDTMFKVIGSIFSPSQEEKKEKKECEDNIEKDIELFINNFMGNLFPSFPKPTKTDSKEVKEEKRLGSWCANQRTNKKNVGSELDQDAVWTNNYKEVKKWYDEHYGQKPFITSKDAEEKRLGSWCANQRTNKKEVKPEVKQEVKQEVTIEDDVVSEVIEANKDNDDVRIVVIQRGDKLEDILNNAISIHTNLHA